MEMFVGIAVGFGLMALVLGTMWGIVKVFKLDQ